MDLKLGDRLADERSEWQVIGRPYTTAGGKTAHVRVESVKQPVVTEIRSWGAHERVGVRREEGNPMMRLGRRGEPTWRATKSATS